MSEAQGADAVLLTGFPAFTARRMLQKIVTADHRARVHLLVREKFRDQAEEFLARLPARARRRVAPVVGDVCDMDLGLSGAEYRSLTEQVTTIYHLAAAYYLGVPRGTAERINVTGTRNVLDLAESCAQLRRVCHFSTAFVSGTRKGVILEDELEANQRFRNIYEETKFRAEVLARDAARRVPVTIFRPGVIVGDSRTGEIDKFDGPYYLMRFIVTSPVDVAVPLPGRGGAPLHLVPIDFVVDAAFLLARHPDAVGMTFHLTDPCPLAARHIYELVAERANRKAPRGSFPEALARALRLPGLKQVSQVPLGWLESFNHLAFYNCRHTLDLLRGSAVCCPSFDTYVDNLIRYVREVQHKRQRQAEEQAFDPLD